MTDRQTSGKTAGRLGISLLAALLALAAACSPAPDEGDESARRLAIIPRDGYLEARDAVGRRLALVPEGGRRPADIPPHLTVTIPVQRVVAATGTFDTGIMAALGVEETIVGLATPPEQWRLESLRRGYDQGRIAFVGLWDTLDYERIKKLRPDLALVSEQPDILDMMAQMDVPTVITYNHYYNNLESRLNFFTFLAAFFDRGDQAKRLRQKFDQTVAEVQNAIGNRPRPGVGWVIFFEKRVFVLSGSIWLSELFNLTGGEYVFKEIEADNEISLEYFVHQAREADILFINPQYAPPRSKADLIRRNPALAPLKSLSAEGRVYLVKDELFQDTGRLDEAVRDLAAIMHPEVYPDRKPLFFDPLPLENLD